MANYFAVGTGNWSGASTVWATSSGGVAALTTPTSSDNVTFDTHSTGTVTIAGTIASPDNCLNMTMTAPGAGTILMAAGKGLNIAGSMTLAAGMTFAPAQTSLLKFTSTSTGQTITSAGYRLGNITFDGIGGGWTLQDALNPSANGIVTLTNGAFDTNSKAVGASSGAAFLSNNSNVRSLALGSTTWTLNGTAGTTIWDITTPTNMIVSAASATINIIANASVTFAGGGASYGTLTDTALSTSTFLTISGVNTFVNLTVSCLGGSGATTSGLALADNQTVTGTITSNGASPAINASNRRIIYSTVPGTPRTITAAAVSFTYMDFRDIVGAGAANWDLSGMTGGSGDAGGNSGITFTAQKNCYIQTTSGSKSFISVTFVTASGGITQIPSIIPLPQDTLLIDGKAFNGAATLTGNVPRLPNIDFTGVTNTPAFTNSVATDFCGNITFVSVMTYTGTAQINLVGRGSRTFESGGIIIPSTTTININTAPNSTYSLASSLTSLGGLTASLGKFALNTFTGTFGTASVTGGTVSGSGTSTLATTAGFSMSGGAMNIPKLTIGTTFSQSGGAITVPALGTITWGTASTWTWTPNTFTFTTGGLPTWTGSSLVVGAAPAGSGGSWLSC